VLPRLLVVPVPLGSETGRNADKSAELFEWRVATAPVPTKFGLFRKEMVFRPSQLRASAEEPALMIPGAFTLQWRYGALTMSVVIVAGGGDRLVETTQ
jgi:hypothetical protein